MNRRKSLLPSVASYWGAPALRRLRDDMDDLFESFFVDVFKTPTMRIFDDIQSNVSFPKINVSETEEDYGIEIAVAGFDKEDVKLELKENTLIISADKKEEEGESDEDKKYIRQEISYRSFRRAVRFPCKVTDEVCAEYKDGIIHVNVKKEIEPERDCGVKIEIK